MWYPKGVDIRRLNVPIAICVTCVVTVVTGVVWGMDHFPPRSAIERIQEDITKIKEDLAFLKGYLKTNVPGRGK